MASASRDITFKDYKDDTTGPMFGSLFAVAQLEREKRQKLADNWWKIVTKWYPHIHSRVYCVPPVHFNSVAYTPAPPPAKKFSVRKFMAGLYSTVKDDEAQPRTQWAFSSFLEQKKAAAFVLSNLEFQNYLNKEYEVIGDNVLPYVKPDMTAGDEGEVDLLIIDKMDGVFVLEIKATGGDERVRPLSEEKKLKELCDKFKSRSKQIEKLRRVMRKLLNAVDPHHSVKIRVGLVLPNFPRSLLEKAFVEFPEPSKELMKAMRVKSLRRVSACTFCSDDLPLKGSSRADSLSEENASCIEKVWTALKEIDGPSTPMSDDLYEHIVALFCGPLTTVKICTERSMPRVRLSKEVFKVKVRGKKNKFVEKEKVKVIPTEIRTMAGAAREVARRFSELVLREEQIQVLQTREDFVHLEGPPGTGKTLMLLLKSLMWLEEGNKVWIISFFPPSRSVTHVLFEQIKRMVDFYYDEEDAKIKKGLLEMFILARPPETLDKKYYRRRLRKFRERAKSKKLNPLLKQETQAYYLPTDRKVCLVVDESGMTGMGLKDFFKQVAICHRRGDFLKGPYDKGFSVWSASVEKCGRPQYAVPLEQMNAEKFGALWKLRMPLRCPPTIQRALILVQPSMDKQNVCFFKEKNMVAHPALPPDPSVEPHEAGPAGPQNQYPAEGLPVFLVNHRPHKRAHEDVWYCDECGKEVAQYLKEVLKIGSDKSEYVMSDIPLQYKDVLIVATQNAFQFSLPVGRFLLAMKKQGLKVAVSTTREEGSAAMSDDDVILVTDMTSVHGLERAVIIIVPEVCHLPPVQTSYTTFFTNEDEDKSTLQEAVAEANGSDFTVTGDGTFEKDRDDGQDAESREEDMDTGSVVDCASVADSFATDNSEALSAGQLMETEEEEDDDDEEDPQYTCYDELVISDSDDDTDAVMETDSTDPQQEKLTGDSIFTNKYSQQTIAAALASLSEQSRRDIFYIGSRAVCQLILIHQAPDIGGQASTQTSDQTDDKANLETRD